MGTANIAAIANQNTEFKQGIYGNRELSEHSRHGSNVSVGFWPSCVERMQLLGALRFCRRVNLVGENVVGVSPGDGEI